MSLVFVENCYKMKGKNLVWNRVWIPWIEAVNGSNSLKKFVQLSEEKSWETWEKSLCLWPRQQKCIQNAPSLRSNFTKINRCVAHKVTKNIYTFKSINLRIQKKLKLFARKPSNISELRPRLLSTNNTRKGYPESLFCWL